MSEHFDFFYSHSMVYTCHTMHKNVDAPSLAVHMQVVLVRCVLFLHMHDNDNYLVQMTLK